MSVAVDVSGLVSAPSATVNATTGTTDTTPPTTTADPAPATPNGDAGWYVTAPQVTLTADEPATTYYAFGSDAPAEYSTPLTLGEGSSTLWFYSTDTAGNTETSKTAEYKVDTVAPDAPTLSSGSVTATTTALSWNPVADATSGLAAYAVYRDGSLLETTTAETYLATGLVRGHGLRLHRAGDRRGGQQVVRLQHR